jgi:asparagine synthase (glutamine-hydrolysing)
MCGICGELSLRGEPVSSAVIRGMRDALVHRGPDDAGVFVADSGRAGLGFRRLRIIDLTANASQPMANEDRSVHLVFNGEIYDFQAIRRGLVARGHQFISQSDTEVIVHLYEEKGPDCITDLDGMFAIGIWDERLGQLTLARDRAGKKPLFYYLDDDRLLFASEIKAFFEHPSTALDINDEAIPYFFIHGYVPSPDTFYRRVRQLEPGTVLTIDRDGRMATRQYWQLRYPRLDAPGTKAPLDRARAVRVLRDLVTRAVERRLVSDVPLGAFLSGGLDSTIVVGLMSQLMSAPVKTFSIGFEGDPAYDETSYARSAATRFRTDHTEFKVTPSAIDLIERLIWHHDGPFGDSSAVPTYIVSQLTRRHVTVVLTGDGGDELFAGYLRFYAGVLSEKIPAVLARSAHALLSRLPVPSSDRHPLARAQRFFGSMTMPLYDRMTRWNSLFYDDLDALLEPSFRATLSGLDRLRYIARELTAMDGLSTLNKQLHANFKSYLLDDLLVKMDRCSMANSLEARSPFLDRELIEFAATLPDDMKLHGRTTKVLLREAFADLLPPDIAARGKMGFGVPLGTWFRGDLRDYLHDMLLGPGARYSPYLARDYVRTLVERHLSGRANLGHQLWSLLCFEQWLRLLPAWRHPSTRVDPELVVPRHGSA